MGLFSGIFGNKKTRDASKITFDEAVDIAGDYGEVLEHMTGAVGDTNKLPYDKEVIKQALIVMLGSIDNSHMRQQIKAAYVSLGDFQDGVGDKDIGFKMSSDPTTARNAKEQAGSAIAQLTKLTEWMSIVDLERGKLIAELKELGCW